jgi:hypothetical protein
MTSQAIHGAWYLPARKQLDLLFASGRRYRYSNVPADLAERFSRAASKGQFFNREIRDRYICRALSEPLPQVA